MKPMKTKIEELEIGDKIFSPNGLFIEILDISNSNYKVINYHSTYRYDKVYRYVGDPYWLTEKEIIMGLNYNSPKTFYFDRYLMGRSDYFEDSLLNKCKEVIDLNQDKKIIDLLTNEKLSKIIEVYEKTNHKHLISKYTLFKAREINMLNKAKITTIEQLLDLTINELQNIKGIGQNSVQHIIYELGIVD